MRAGSGRGRSVIHCPSQQAGFAYIAVLVALLIVSLGTQGVMTFASQQAQRDREETLLRVGAAYALAIGAYYIATPGSVKRWPPSLEVLLEDKRLVNLHRHLRELYPDPVTRQLDWELVYASDGGIQGIRSHSTLVPLRTGAVNIEGMVLPPAKSYSDWQFVFVPDNPAPNGNAPAKSI
jgi:type II secretory pathway pseudopilin PulG